MFGPWYIFVAVNVSRYAMRDINRRFTTSMSRYTRLQCYRRSEKIRGSIDYGLWLPVIECSETLCNARARCVCVCVCVCVFTGYNSEAYASGYLALVARVQMNARFNRFSAIFTDEVASFITVSWMARTSNTRRIVVARRTLLVRHTLYKRTVLCGGSIEFKAMSPAI